MEVKDGELITLTQFRRDLTKVVNDLAEGKVEKAIVMKNNRFLCVVVTVPTFEAMAEAGS